MKINDVAFYLLLLVLISIIIWRGFQIHKRQEIIDKIVELQRPVTYELYLIK